MPTLLAPESTHGPAPGPPETPSRLPGVPLTAEPDFTSQAYVGAITHFYRGELSRTIAWRERFDTTTNWSVVGTGSLIAYAVQQPEWTNMAFVLNLFVLGFFAFLEARRFRFYDAYHARVRLLEAHFIAPTLLGHDKRLLRGTWREKLAEDLLMPQFKCTLAFALGRRFKRTYFGLHAFVLASWFGLVAIRPEVMNPSDWVEAFSIQRIPGWITLAALFAYHFGLFVFILRSGALRRSSDEMIKPSRDVHWNIEL